MNQIIWVIDADPTSAQSARSALDVLGVDVHTFDTIPDATDEPAAALIAGSFALDELEAIIADLRRRNGGDMVPVAILGELEGSAEALALGADHFMPHPIRVGDLVDHLGRFVALNPPPEPERVLTESRGAQGRAGRQAHDEAPEEMDANNAEDEARIAEDDEPVADDEMLEAEDEARIAEDDEPVADDEVLKAEGEVPIAEDEEPVADDEVLKAEGEVPIAEDEEPVADDEVLKTEGEMPIAEDEGLGIEDASRDAEPQAFESEPPATKDNPAANVAAPAQPEAAQDADANEPKPPQTEVFNEEASTPPTEPLFGLKQPEEANKESAKSAIDENRPTETVVPTMSDTPQNPTENADDAWGLDSNFDAQEPQTAGWGEASQDAGSWGEAAVADSNTAPADDGWGSDTGGGWGEPDTKPSWNEAPTDAWSAGTSSSNNLSELGASLVAPTPQPQAPVGPLGTLSETGILGLLGRCGHDRVTGRITTSNQGHALALYFNEGRLVALASNHLDRELLIGAQAQGWVDAQEVAAIRHLQQRRHCSAAAVLTREGIRSAEEVQQLTQDTAERCLLRAAHLPGGHAEFVPETAGDHAVAVSRLDTATRLITLCESLTQAPIWGALIGGDDAAPELRVATMSEALPGRDALHRADGQRSLFDLASATGVAIEDVRIGCLAALAMGHLELRRVGVSHVQRSHRPDRAFNRAVEQIRSGDYFAVLGLSDAHSAAEVHRAFASRVSLLRLHLHIDHPRFTDLYGELEEAREVLLDPDLRAQYRTAKPQTGDSSWPCETS